MLGDGSPGCHNRSHPSALRGKAQDLHLARPWVLANTAYGWKVAPVAKSLNLPREPFLPKILTKSVVVFCSRLLIQCSDKGWQNARGVGNIVPRITLCTLA